MRLAVDGLVHLSTVLERADNPYARRRCRPIVSKECVNQRPPFYADVAKFPVFLIDRIAPGPFRRTTVDEPSDRGPAETAPLWPPVKTGFDLVHRAAGMLKNQDALSGSGRPLPGTDPRRRQPGGRRRQAQALDRA